MSSPDMLVDVFREIGNFIDSLEVRKPSTGPTEKTKGNSVVISWNIFPVNIQETFDSLVDAVDTSFSRVSPSGEEIFLSSGVGRIKDQGREDFRILRGEVREYYLFNQEVFVYLRILLEQSVDTEETWISLDCDYIKESPWFEE